MGIRKFLVSGVPYLLVSLLFLSVYGCGGGGSGGTTSSTDTSLSVSSTVPAAGATGISVGDPLTATFNEGIISSSINNKTFTLKDASGTQVTGTVSCSGATATFVPSVALSYSSTYTATITNAVEAAGGIPMASQYVWRFTTVASSAAPVVTSTWPMPNAIFC